MRRFWNFSRLTQPGFSLVELVVAMAVLAVVAAIAAPAFDGITMSSRLTAGANEYQSAVQLARSEAIKRRADVVLCASTSGTTCASSGDWQQGWIVMHGSSVLLAHPALETGYLLKESAGSRSFTFDAMGALKDSTARVLKLCRSTPSVGSQDRQIDLSATGRALITKTQTGTCQ